MLSVGRDVALGRGGGPYAQFLGEDGVSRVDVMCSLGMAGPDTVFLG